MARSVHDRVGIIRAIETPLGFFVLVVLIVETGFGAIVYRSPSDMTWLLTIMVVLIFFVVGVVGFLTYHGKGWGVAPTRQEGGSNSTRYSVLVGPPEDMPDLDVAIIEWDDAQCFLIGVGIKLKEPITLVPTRLGPTFRVQIPERVLDQLRPEYPLELQLKDRKGHRWRVRRFFIFENLLPLAFAEAKEGILKDYGGEE